ncbi:MAG: lipase family protein [Campylobacterota bacterium]|nr:lipase family protein [Campylobacterota bacterium]
MFKKHYILPAVIASTLMFSGCSIDNTGLNTVGGNLVDASIIEEINASTMLSIVNASIDPSAVNAFGYKAVKITYDTKGQNDEDIKASGLLVIPIASQEYQAYRASQGQSQFSISMICDNHGTIFTDAEAPSNIETSNGIPDHPLAVTMTSYAGFAAVLPDYIGYGESNDKSHPYLLKKASARSSLDMIKASIRYMTENGILFNGQLYISGYSQGGYNALALAQDIEQNHSDELQIKGVAPMAAPSQLKSFGDAVLQSDATMSVPAFMAYIADAYSNSYDNLTLQEMIQDTKEAAFDGLFAGDKNSTMIHYTLGMGLNAPTNQLFEDDFITQYSNDENHKLKQLFNANDVVMWNSNSKINLIHCSNDDVVPASISAGAYAYLTNYGSTDVTLTLIDGVTADYSAGESIHANCATSTYGTAISWFSQIREGN